MRRLLSTVYRLFLTVASISALVLSILAATSCDFLDFVHPYKANGRLVLKDRQLEDAMLDSVATSFADVGDTTTPTTVGLVNTDYLAQLADSISQAGNLTDGTATLDDEALAQAAGVIAAVTNGTVDASSSAEAGNSTETQSTTAASSNETTASNTTDSIADTSVSGRDPSSSTVSSGTKETSNKTMTSNTTASKTSASNKTATSNTTTANKTNDSIPNIPSNAYGLNKSDIPSVAMSGSAGLFCAANDVSIYDIWKGAFLDSELALDEESDHDESEDIARNGAVVSITFGVLVAFIFVVETIFGFRMCLEKWIVSLLAICACVSQGVTFLFFNSERYCDANIIHEILSQDPCVPAQGGIYSVVALILYAFIIILVCCAPSADPYHLLCCCRSQKESAASDPNFSSLELSENKSSDGVHMDSGDESNVALSGRDHDGAPWMSEEDKEKKENEII